MPAFYFELEEKKIREEIRYLRRRKYLQECRREELFKTISKINTRIARFERQMLDLANLLPKMREQERGKEDAEKENPD